MAKKQVQQKQTMLHTPAGTGEQMEQVVTVDDLALPSPEELAQYKAVDDRIVDFLIESSKREQAHRHEAELKKIDIVRRSEKRIFRINWWGMCFAFLSLVTIFAVAALALYLNHEWFAGIMSSVGVAGVLTVFIDAGRNRKG